MTDIRGRLAALSAVVVLIVGGACGPPPPDPSVLPGALSHTTRQELRVEVGVSGAVFDCLLYLDAIWDLGYRSVRVTSKISAAGECPSQAWVQPRAIAACWVGDPANGVNCGAGWSLPVERTNVSQVFRTMLPDGTPTTPHLARFTDTFQASLTLPTGALAAVATEPGWLPQIRCSAALELCKFQG